MVTSPRPALFATADHVARAFGPDDVAALQALLEANPGYFVTVAGQAPGPDQAQAWFDDQPPPHLPISQRWLMGLYTHAGTLQGTADVVSDLCAPGVWHIGLYFWADTQHGSGAPRQMHQALRAWATQAGAQWLRLGVVLGNTRGERFWQSLGYQELRQRHGLRFELRVNTVRVMVLPLHGQPLADYLALVPRDQPGSDLP